MRSGDTMPGRVYLDYNASTPVAAEAQAVMADAMVRCWGNPSSGHWAGREGKACVDAARGKVAAALRCGEDEVFFTSGGTESNNWAIFGAVAARQKALGLPATKGHVVTTDIEHPAVMEVAKQLQARGLTVTYLPTGAGGSAAPADLLRVLEKTGGQDVLLVTVMHANNETGVLQPVRALADIAQRYGIPVHTDAAQSIGKVPVLPEALNVDLLSVCSHKFYGPKGVGALYVKRGFPLEKQLYGAGHERGLRPGTENIILAAGMAEALRLTTEELESRSAHMAAMKAYLAAALAGHFELEINGAAPCLPNTLNCSLRRNGRYLVASRVIPRIADRVAISAGSACHSGAAKVSYVHAALGLSTERALAGFRISTGAGTTHEEIDAAVAALATAAADEAKL
eukprot:TRINITY_DN8562_c0_g1_i2.p1 TRINITY_DN8562_c0_g1~~TRINITY_DN8562_c0_g1_i2.p1  ORF type:complete len:399 (+),score=125.66 TRINITY_DN8562_c0_g1_i2:43-1239(+)